MLLPSSLKLLFPIFMPKKHFPLSIALSENLTLLTLYFPFFKTSVIMKTMLTLGIDPGTATTGFGLVTERKQQAKFVDCGTIKTSSKESSQSRLRIIYSETKNLIKTFKPDCLAIEKLFFGKNSRTAMQVGQARGIILLAAAEGKVRIAEYTPLEVKMALTGYGRAEKRQIQKMVQTLLGLGFLPKPDDAADALAIAICHQHTYKIMRNVECGVRSERQ